MSLGLRLSAAAFAATVTLSPLALADTHQHAAPNPAALAAAFQVPATDLANLQAQLKQQALPELIASRHVSIQGSDLPWTDTGLDLEEGQQVSFLLQGRLFFAPDVWFEPGMAFWAAIGDKRPIYNAGQNTGSWQAPRSGRLYVARSIAEWATPDGQLRPSAEQYQQVPGKIEALILVWKNAPEAGLRSLQQQQIQHALIQAELKRLKNPPQLPAGWSNLWLFDGADIFRQEASAAGPMIHVKTQQSVGILQKPVDLPLSDDLSLSWDWKMLQLPSEQLEREAFTHDYISIAVRFDDGQDLTYMWSRGLEIGDHFRCPLPGWDQVETHYVLRNHGADFYAWLGERRDLKKDYDRYIGGKAQRITHIWIIANSLFQRGTGEAWFRNIQLHQGQTPHHVL